MALGPGCTDHEALELFATHRRLCELERQKLKREQRELDELFRSIAAELRAAA